MDLVYVALACMAGLVLVMSLFTSRLRHGPLSEPVLAILAGIAIGPVGLGWLASEGDGRVVLEETARVTLALVLVSVGLGLPHRYLREGWRSLAVLTLGAMVLTWGAATALLVGILGLDLLPALLIGAVVTPLDPVLASGVAVGKVAERELPGRVRHLLSLESAASHGLGYLLVLLPAYLLAHPADAWARWSTEVLLRDGAVAVVLGGLIGLLAGRAHRWSLARGLTGAGPLITTLVALALATLALLQLVGSSGLLAVLVAGIAYARARTGGGGKSDEIDRERLHYETTFKQILQVPVFVLLGAALPWRAWADLGWAGPGLVAAILLLRRVPIVFLLRPFVPQLRRRDETLFVGWFGALGVGALHFALAAEAHAHLEQAWVVGSLLIAASVAAHDLTAAWGSRWLHRRTEETRRPA